MSSLVLLDGATGQVLDKDGRSVVLSDQKGQNFPSTPKLLQKSLCNIVISREGIEANHGEALKGKYRALYFCAHGCPRFPSSVSGQEPP